MVTPPTKSLARSLSLGLAACSLPAIFFGRRAGPARALRPDPTASIPYNRAPQRVVGCTIDRFHLSLTHPFVARLKTNALEVATALQYRDSAARFATPTGSMANRQSPRATPLSVRCNNIVRPPTPPDNVLTYFFHISAFASSGGCRGFRRRGDLTSL